MFKKQHNQLVGSSIMRVVAMIVFEELYDYYEKMNFKLFDLQKIQLKYNASSESNIKT